MKKVIMDTDHQCAHHKTAIGQEGEGGINGLSRLISKGRVGVTGSNDEGQTYNHCNVSDDDSETVTQIAKVPGRLLCCH
jgi:hypothetical protein